MTEDIVTRLHDCIDYDRELLSEAADEINDLRKLLATQVDELEKELLVTKYQLSYWREKDLERE